MDEEAHSSSVSSTRPSNNVPNQNSSSSVTVPTTSIYSTINNRDVTDDVQYVATHNSDVTTSPFNATNSLHTTTSAKEDDLKSKESSAKKNNDASLNLTTKEKTRNEQKGVEMQVRLKKQDLFCISINLD